MKIAIIGIDGSGKSSCYRNVIKKLSKEKIAGIGDIIFLSKSSGLKLKDINYTKVEDLIGKNSKNIVNRELYKLMKLSDLILKSKIHEQIEKANKTDFIVTEGSPLINTLAWGRYYRPNLFTKRRCQKVISYLSEKRIPLFIGLYYLFKIPEVYFINRLGIKIQKPDIVFFLKVNPKKSLERISKRGKKRQIHETLKFLTMLQDNYEKVCSVLKENTKINVINTDNKSLNQVSSIIYNKIKKPLSLRFLDA